MLCLNDVNENVNPHFRPVIYSEPVSDENIKSVTISFQPL